jgi:hypothetical protein
VSALGADAFPPAAGGAPVVVPGETTAAAARREGRPEPVVASSFEARDLADVVRRAIDGR